MTKPIIVVKMPGCKLLYIIQIIFLVPKILVAYNYSYNAASDWPRTFSQPGCFCLGIYIQY